MGTEPPYSLILRRRMLSFQPILSMEMIKNLFLAHCILLSKGLSFWTDILSARLKNVGLNGREQTVGHHCSGIIAPCGKPVESVGRICSIDAICK